MGRCFEGAGDALEEGGWVGAVGGGGAGSPAGG